MEFEWDPDKAVHNVLKHGVSFEEAALVFNDPGSFDIADDSGLPEEERWRLIGLKDLAVLVVVYTERPPKIRIISARRANRHEQKLYYSQNNP
jgi:uncharacterized protein